MFSLQHIFRTTVKQYKYLNMFVDKIYKFSSLAN